jgi:hypothetical protein
MKIYIATFWRGNRQLADGGYETTRTIEANTEALAKKKAQKLENCCYGSMTLKKIELA